MVIVTVKANVTIIDEKVTYIYVKFINFDTEEDRRYLSRK
jgi:hypothetical protein